MLTQDPVVFLALHVPKCAGRTIERHMESHLPAEQCWITRRGFSVSPMSWGRSYRLAKGQDLSQVRFISGHYLGRSIARRLPRRSLRRSVLIREPISFLLSYYNFRMMRYIAQGWKPYSFDLHLRSLPHDPISHFLLASWLEISWLELLAMAPERKYELLNRQLAQFWYVADYSRCDELIALLGEGLGVPAVAERVNTQKGWTERVDWRPLSRRDLAQSTVEEIAARTRVDQALWQSWADAGLGAAGVRPIPLASGKRLGFPAAEARRPLYEAARRFQRGWF